MKKTTLKERIMDFVTRQRPLQLITMIDKDRIAQISDLHAAKKSFHFISRLTGLCRETVAKYAKNPTVENQKPGRKSIFEPFRETIKVCFFKCCGNCAAAINMFKEKIGKNTLKFSDRAFRKFCEGYRVLLKQLKTEHEIYKNYETEPGTEMQIDFGSKWIVVAGELIEVHFFEAILSYSRRIFVKAYDAENLTTWKDGCVSAFKHYGGIPTVVLSDNAKALVKEHPRNKPAIFSDGWLSFSRQWKFTPMACPVRTPTCKAKVERGVQYIKDNALVGREFDGFEELNEYLVRWSVEISDQRVLRDPLLPNRTPAERFLLEIGQLKDLQALKPEPLELVRRVEKTCLVHVEGKRYRVPEIAANKDVHILIDDRTMTVKLNGETIATLDKAQSVYTPLMLKFNPDTQKMEPSTKTGATKTETTATTEEPNSGEINPNPIGRSMKEYEKALGGNWNE